MMEEMMTNQKIFLAAPISGFSDENDYKQNRNMLLELIEYLEKQYFVYSEIKNFNSLESYDEPGESAIKDFKHICESDFFIMFHPKKMQSSTLIELGYAIAKDKKIIVIGEKDSLPYLTLGLSKYSSKISIIQTNRICEETLIEISKLLSD